MTRRQPRHASRAAAVAAAVALVAVVGGVPSGAAEPTPAPSAAPTASPAALVARWEQALAARQQARAELPAVEAALAAAAARAAGAAADLSGLRSERRAVAAGERRAQEALRAAQSSLQRAAGRLVAVDGAFAAQRGTVAEHAAAMYKFGASELGALETMLRSGSPAQGVMHLRVRQSIAGYDEHVLGRLAAVHDDAGMGLAGADAVWRGWAKHAAWWRRVTAALDALVDDQAGLARSSGAARARQAAAAGHLRRRVGQMTQKMQQLEKEVAAIDPAAAQALARRRVAADEESASARESSHPYLDRPVTVPRWASPLGYGCPVPGATFVNDWAFPRPGGRTHQGTDLFAPRGTPVLAVADGVVAEVDMVDAHDGGGVSGDLGGKTVALRTAGGQRWYYAHLDGIADDVQPGDHVKRGAVLGWVGDSGNARGTPPHLHLGRYLGGGAANPYPALYLACVAEVGPPPQAPPAG